MSTARTETRTSSWRAPVDAFRYGRRLLVAAALGHRSSFLGLLAPASTPSHERLEAAMLRAAREECLAYLSRVGPRAAARRKRRLAAARGGAPRDEM